MGLGGFRGILKRLYEIPPAFTETVSQFNKRLICTCHAGLVADCRCLISYSQHDPASSSVTLWKNWIPDQARNDKNTNVRSFANYDTASQKGGVFFELNVSAIGFLTSRNPSLAL